MDESAESRQRRLRLLVRRNRGQTDFRTYFVALEHLLGSEIPEPHKLDLQTTDRLFAAYKQLLQESADRPQRRFQKTWAYEPSALWFSECVRIGATLQGLGGVLFVGPYEYCGAINAAPERVLRAARPLLDFDGDSIGVVALDGASGLYLDKFEENSEWLVELIVCGDWAGLIMPAV